MNTNEEILQSDAWWSGVNKEADEALNLALDALRLKDTMRCFACVRAAMMRYGWELHSEPKARSLWKRWDQIAEKLRDSTAARQTAIVPAIEELFHETFHAVHYDRNRRIRRNRPPRDPASRIDLAVPIGGLDIGGEFARK